MYGQHVTIELDGITATVFVFGLPDYADEEWQRLALEKLLREIKAKLAEPVVINAEIEIGADDHERAASYLMHMGG